MLTGISVPRHTHYNIKMLLAAIASLLRESAEWLLYRPPPPTFSLTLVPALAVATNLDPRQLPSNAISSTCTSRCDAYTKYVGNCLQSDPTVKNSTDICLEICVVCPRMSKL